MDYEPTSTSAKRCSRLQEYLKKHGYTISGDKGPDSADEIGYTSIYDRDGLLLINSEEWVASYQASGSPPLKDILEKCDNARRVDARTRSLDAAQAAASPNPGVEAGAKAALPRVPTEVAAATAQQVKRINSLWAGSAVRYLTTTEAESLIVLLDTAIDRKMRK